MRCEDIGLLKAYTDGELTEEEKLTISEHVKSCQRCRSMLEEMQHSIHYQRDAEKYKSQRQAEGEITLVMFEGDGCCDSTSESRDIAAEHHRDADLTDGASESRDYGRGYTETRFPRHEPSFPPTSRAE